MKAGDRPQLVFSQNGEPGGLYCADETDGEALRACDQTMEGLYGYEIDGTAAIPVLADKCDAERRLHPVDLHAEVRRDVP